MSNFVTKHMNCITDCCLKIKAQGFFFLLMWRFNLRPQLHFFIIVFFYTKQKVYKAVSYKNKFKNLCFIFNASKCKK